MSTPEKRVQNPIMEYLKSLQESGHPIMYERRQALACSKKGLPDIWVLYNGVHIEIECKRLLGGELSTMQEKQRDRFIRAGAIYISPRSKEEVVKLFNELIIPTDKTML